MHGLHVMHDHVRSLSHTCTRVCNFKQELSIGVPVSKKFGTRYFHGVIVSSDVDDKGRTLWHIKYDDSDEEDLSDSECTEVARNHRKLK